ncbi:MAG: AraC family transcriptional regulator, partial [Thiohalocapsa sp.]
MDAELDPLAGLLDGPRARGAFALRVLMSPPWCLRVVAESPLTFLAVIKGQAYVIPDQGEPIRLGVGDVAVTRAPDHYRVADDPRTPIRVVIHPGQRCTSLDGESLADQLYLGTRTWGNDPRGPTLMLVGAYESTGDLSPRLLRALPPVLSLAHSNWESPLVALLCEEMAKDLPGQAAVLDRLLDLLLIAVLRAWFNRPEAAEPSWTLSQADPVIGRALTLMHRDPAKAWSLFGLARELGVSRAALARRFQAVVGESPIAFLTRWRLALAADLLCEPRSSVTRVAEQVGYSSPYAFSSAFKRVRGLSPREHRERMTSSAWSGAA